MFEAVESFRQFDYFSILLRLALAMFFGGVIGLEGARKGRPAGFRTYMLVCLGAALTMLLGQYELHMTEVHWADHQQFIGAEQINRADQRFVAVFECDQFHLSGGIGTDGKLFSVHKSFHQ